MHTCRVLQQPPTHPHKSTHIRTHLYRILQHPHVVAPLSRRLDDLEVVGALQVPHPLVGLALGVRLGVVE